MSKFHNIKTTNADGLVFDSKREAARYEELRMLEMAGQIRGLQRQCRWALYAWPTDEMGDKNGVRVGVYVADADYDELQVDGSWLHVTEDTKSGPTRTAVYRLKSKIYYANYGRRIREVL